MDGKFKLNSEQLKAIKHGTGPLLIIAGAGTGKTTVITERIKHLILEKKIKPSEILALTFTEKASREMQGRIDEALPYGYSQMWIMTFHSFCDRILRSSALNIGYDQRYRLMTEAEAIQLIRSNYFEFNLDYFRPLGNPTKFIAGMFQHFSRLQDEDVTPGDYLDWVNRQKIKKNRGGKEEQLLEIKKWKELASAFRTYEEIKVRNGYMDFGDLITKTLKLFRERANVLKEYRNQFRYILVDEFQDTNYAQNEIVKLLAGKNGNITVVADDDQSIYRWRGAAVSNVIQFKISFPKTRIVTLTRNYRTLQGILDRAYNVIQNNNPDRLEVVEKINKRLISQASLSGAKKEGESIKFLHADRVENEADSVAREIIKLTSKKEGGEFDFGDIAILVRANKHAEPFQRALTRHSIPHQFLGPGKLFRQPEIVDLISYLKILYNFEDSVAVFRILSLDYFNIPPRDLVSIGNYARRKNISVFGTMENIGDVIVGDKTKEKVKQLTKIISKHLTLIRKETAGQLLYDFLETTGLLQYLLNPENPSAQTKALNISRFFDKLKTYETDHEDASVQAVVDWIELSMELGESPLAVDSDWGNVNAVNILTVHSAKGLEFPVVFIVNLVGQRFPSIERQEQIPISVELIKEILPMGDYHLQEERRLYYVGMTRAKVKLYLTAADYYGEGKREKDLSPFIYETFGNEIKSEKTKSTINNQMNLLEYWNPEKIDKTSEVGLKNNQKIDYLSVSQIETFRICPMHYKLKYVYKLPTSPSASLSFGISIHSALKSFFDLVKRGERPSRKIIFDCLQSSWIMEGYLSKKHEDMFFSKGKLYLEGFLKLGFDSRNQPELMEFPFIIPLPTLSDNKSRNYPFLKIGGKIDRVDILKDGSVEIIDYKTGANIPTKKEIDRDLQLSFYALAAMRLKDPPFARRLDEIKLSFYFLDIQQKISTVRTWKEIQETIKYTYQIREEIENSDFECSGNILCKNCEYKLFCNSNY